jgi:hypothetical protein
MDRESRSRAFGARDGQSRRSRIACKDATLNVNVTRDRTGTHIQILDGQNDPEVIQRLLDALRNHGAGGGELHLQDAVSYSPRRADIGYLKSAYLAAFAKLGYTYILRIVLNRVRVQILDPCTRRLEVVRLYARHTGAHPREFLLFERPVRCLGVRIDHSVVCLPSIDGNDDFYEELAALRSSRGARAWSASATMKWPHGLELALDFGEVKKTDRPARNRN